ncbi:PREDICTED: protein kinase kin1-like, partial [Nicrophorus vespilloides]|uniref:Protein kinase kin1-like n=1 Tax=Nicrophorus vespilloides TaxID=110193 RepID=A0ABM1N320_NICVS
HGNIYYLVTELVGGGDLCNFIKGQRNGKLEEHYTRVFARQLISAISHMHNQGIVHRDLKMENIMLNQSNDKIKIVDFGLSNIYNGENPLRTHCGSPEYAAPELFVEGKHYGPEVDLWSLGVILYGMVVGQLPFISSSRDGAVITPQQRRKKLLEQINKGLSNTHKKALALFSSEFKAMMAKLLVADSSKRINITELIFHPWVTEKGRKAIRSNPLKKLDESAQMTILKEVSELTGLNFLDIQNAVKSDHLGNIAGLYNLLVHRRKLTHMEGESIVTPHYTTPGIQISSKPILNTPRISKTRSTTQRHNTLKSAPIQKGLKHEMSPTRRIDMIPLRVEKKQQGDLKQAARQLSSKEAANVKERSANLRRLASSQEIKRIKCDSLTPQDPTLRSSGRKRINDTCEKKIVRPIPKLLTNLSPTPKGDSKTKSTEYDLYNDLLYSMSIPTRNSRINRKSTENDRIPSSKQQLRRTTRTQSANVSPENAIMKSIQVAANRRPLTTGPTHTAERAAKRRSMLPVMTNRRSPNKGAATAPSNLLSATLQKVSSDNGLCDDHKHQVSSPVKRCRHRMAFCNKPIARSIADYVAKNISSKLEPSK